jgi:RNA polymerase sigma-70 factor (ECF subfamily)
VNGDLDVIQKVLGGERNAYAELVRKYEARVRGLCRAMLGGAEPAEDAAQEIFIKCYQALSKFRQDSSFSTWLYRIAVNHCHDLQRKIARRKTESWEALVEKEGERIERLFAVSPERESGPEAPELLHRLLAHLSEKSRTVLILREVQGLSYQAMAETLKCSLDAIKARLKRARRELSGKARHFIRPEGV